MKYYVEFSTTQNNQNNSKAGKKFYNELPADTYFAMGINGSEAGQAYLFCYDAGTCLLPFRHIEDNTFVIIPEKATK